MRARRGAAALFGACAIAIGACAPIGPFEPGVPSGTDTKSLAERERDLLDRARAARASGEFEAATRLYREAVTSAQGVDNSARVLVELGDLLARMNQPTDAYTALTSALTSALDKAQDPAIREAAFAGIGQLYQRLRRYSESVAFYDKALGINPQNARALIGRGVALDMSGLHDQAQASYMAALAVEPGDTRAQNNLALSYAFAGQFNKAVEILHPMATSPGSTPQLRQNLALVYGLMGNGELAGSILRRDLDEATVRTNLRNYEILRRMPNPAEALAGASG